MATPTPAPRDILEREILDDARRQAEAIIQQARNEAQVILTKADAEAEQVRQTFLSQARAEAGRLTEAARAALPAQLERRRSARVESLLQSIREEARQRLIARQGFDYGDTLVALVAEAARQMPGEALTIRLSPADRAAYGARLGAVTLVDDPTLTDGGITILDAEGHRILDNHLTARLDRLWPELRRRIATEAGLL